MIYFDNAASSFPKPPCVLKAVTKWLQTNGANPGRSGHKMSIAASELVFDTRSAISDLFGVSSAERIAFVPNATYGLNMIIQGCVEKGDHIIVTDLEHNSVLRPVYLMSRLGVEYDVASVDLYDDQITVSNILEKCKKNTKLVVCTHCSNVCGKILPVSEIKNSLGNDIKLLVDGSQAAGIIPTDLERMNIDYYCAPSHKGLLGPQGCGFVAILSDLPRSILTGGTGSESFEMKQPDYLPDAFESGTLPTPVIAGLLAGIKYIKNKDINKIYEHKKFLTEYFYKQLKEIPESINYIDYEKAEFVGAACFNIKNRHSEEIGEYLNKNEICVRSGYHCAPLFHRKMKTDRIGMVRVSFGNFNTTSEINRLKNVLNNF